MQDSTIAQGAINILMNEQWTPANKNYNIKQWNIINK